MLSSNRYWEDSAGVRPTSWTYPTPGDLIDATIPHDIIPIGDGPSIAVLRDTSAGPSNDSLFPLSHSIPIVESHAHVDHTPLPTPKWDIPDELPEKRTNSSALCRMPTLSASMPPADLWKQISEYAKKGVPVVVQGLHQLPGWAADIFTPEWFAENGSKEDFTFVRNVYTREDKSMSLPEFIALSRITAPISPTGETERYYGKDMPCPQPWQQWLSHSRVVPENLLPFGPEDVLRHVDPKDRVETLMTYVGIGDTYTPCHKDLCASLGQNLMLYTEENGSALWFMTAREDALKASTYFHTFNEELDLESHTVTVGQFSRAPFPVYVHEQKLGDLVLVPQRSCHQVVNRGGISIKLSWSRMTVSSLELALKLELPIYRRVCRLETYRVKDAIQSTLTALTTAVKKSVNDGDTDSARCERVDLDHVLKLYEEILIAEWDPKHRGAPEADFVMPAHPYHHICDFCGADIFQSYFECKACDRNDLDPQPLSICSGCFVEGRTCEHVMQPVQLVPFDHLLEIRNAARQVLGIEEKPDPAALWIRSSSVPHIHEAACILQEDQWRNSKEEPVIRCRQAHTHEAPRLGSIHCNLCHKRICASHLLTVKRCHSVKVISTFTPGDHSSWHNLHKVSKDAYKEMDALHKSGTPLEALDPHYRLVFATLSFRKCCPMDKRVRLGFYDEHFDRPKLDMLSSTPVSPFKSESPAKLLLEKPSLPNAPETITNPADGGVTPRTVSHKRPRQSASEAEHLPGSSQKRARRLRHVTGPHPFVRHLDTVGAHGKEDEVELATRQPAAAIEELSDDDDPLRLGGPHMSDHAMQVGRIIGNPKGKASLPRQNGVLTSVPNGVPSPFPNAASSQSNGKRVRTTEAYDLRRSGSGPAWDNSGIASTPDARPLQTLTTFTGSPAQNINPQTVYVMIQAMAEEMQELRRQFKEEREAQRADFKIALAEVRREADRRDELSKVHLRAVQDDLCRTREELRAVSERGQIIAAHYVQHFGTMPGFGMSAGPSHGDL